ncbi:hypothetical protein PY479_05170 [Shewanella sp. A32]|uniref:hypothetical protein n=1 Tax=Shewanella sp. A32 TaxID=3031327 RepID=UPI0023B8B762|nr:hypothetical protein [Shewanella sp. A32]MDF0533670.1 hypothetical protein [Shewanella sp. A32]
MGLPVTVYRHSDPGAPQLTEFRPSEILNIFKKCLVEGYGAKAGAGWSVAFEDAAAFKLALRNSPEDGSGGYLRIWSGSNNVDATFYMNCGKSMTDIDTLLNPIGYRSMRLATTFMQGQWQLIATSRSFWFVLESTYPYSKSSISALTYNIANTSGLQQYQQIAFIGDLDTTDPNDSSAFTLVSSSNSTTDYANIGYLYCNYSNCYCTMWDVNGDNSAKMAYSLLKPFSSYNTLRIEEAESLGIAHTLMPISVFRDTDVPSANFPNSRGVVPGIFHSSFYGYGTRERPFDNVMGGKLYTLLFNYYTLNCWINLEEWYV